MEFLQSFWNFVKNIRRRLRRLMRPEPERTPPPVGLEPEPPPPPVEPEPEPRPPPVEPEPEPRPPPVEPEPEPRPPPVEPEPEPPLPPAEPEPETAPPPVEPEPEPAPPPVEPEPEPTPPPVAAEPEPAPPFVEPEPEPAPSPAQPDPEPTPPPVEPEQAPPPGHAKLPRAPRVSRPSSDEGPRTPREPWRFGPRRSNNGEHSGRGEADHPRPPELCCRREGLEWTIFLRVASDLGVTSVHLGGEELVAEEGEYRLPRFTGSISLKGEGAESKNIPLFDGREPLVFRLPRSGEGSFGRHCHRIGNGEFLVIAPHTESRSGTEFREPEPCSDPEFLAHFVTTPGDNGSESLGAIGKWSLQTGRTASLTGDAVFDNSDEGNLFVEPPRLKSTEGIEWARIGEERPGGWKGQNFLASNGFSDLLDGRRGRFFLRTYRPGETREDDSTAFRYWPDLEEILVDGEEFRKERVLIPLPSGTEMTTVQLVDRRGGPLVPGIRSKHARLDDGAVVVEPTPEGDEVRLLLRDGMDEVNVVVDLPRIWWRLEGSVVWTDQPIEMSRSEFRRPGEALEILMPFRLPGLSIGLEGEYRSFEARADRRFPHKSCCRLELGAFADYPILSENVDRAVLQIRVPNSEVTPVDVLVVQPERVLGFSDTNVTATPVRLIRRETPEVRQGTIEIRALGRIPRIRSKIAVSSRAPGVDPVAACRGPANARIEAVREDLDGEQIDLIPWDPDPRVLARTAFHPVQVIEVRQLHPRRGLIVEVPRQSVSAARGTKDQNLKLAKQILGLEISIVPGQSSK